MRQLFGMFHSAFDHAGVAVDDMIAEGDKVFVLARMTGIQRGDFMGIPATGGTINVDLCDYFRVDNGALGSHGRRRDDAAADRALTIQRPARATGRNPTSRSDDAEGARSGNR